jgi:tetratricopeptide (TPR) repeat protein
MCVTLLRPCCAGVIVLTSGEKITGLITSKNLQTLQISVDGQLRTYNIEDVREIRGRQPLPEEIRLAPLDEPMDFKTALNAGARGEFLRAQKALEKIVRADPSDANASQALYICRRVAENSLSQDYALCVLQGISKMLDDDYEAAVTLFNKALSRSPRSIDVYYNLGCVYLLMGKDAQAVPYFERLIEGNPNNKDVLYKLGASFYSLGKYSKARVYFERLVALEPDNPEVYAYLGSTYQAMDQNEKGSGYLRKAKALFQEQGQFQRAWETDSLLR